MRCPAAPSARHRRSARFGTPPDLRRSCGRRERGHRPGFDVERAATASVVHRLVASGSPTSLDEGKGDPWDRGAGTAPVQKGTHPGGLALAGSAFAARRCSLAWRRRGVARSRRGNDQTACLWSPPHHCPAPKGLSAPSFRRGAASSFLEWSLRKHVQPMHGIDRNACREPMMFPSGGGASISRLRTSSRPHTPRRFSRGSFCDLYT